MNVFLVTGLYTIRLWVHLAPPYNESRYPLTIYQIEAGRGHAVIVSLCHAPANF